MTEWNDFDKEVMEALDALPPSAETVAAVTPWHTAINRIIWGLVLLTFQFKFLYLDTLLPAAGAALLYLGFRSLRTANRYFYFGWIISICKVILLYISTVLLATPFEGNFPKLITVLLYLPTPLLYLSLWLGIRRAAADVGHASARQPALWALLWYGALTLLALYVPQPGWIPVLIMAALYICILRSLLLITRQLAFWGYDVPVSPARFGAGRFGALYLGTLAVFTVLAAVLSSHAVPEFVPADRAADSPRALTELGFPEDAAAQLLPEDLERLSGAVRCDALGHSNPLYGSDGDNEHQNQIYAFLMPDGSVQIVQLFVPDETGGFWRCRIQLSCNARIYDASARLTYQRGDRRFTAAVDFDECAVTRGTDFFGFSFEQYTAQSRPFSWPLHTDSRAAYVIFSADQEANAKTTLNEYVHYGAASLPSYPYETAQNYAWFAGTSFYYGDGSGLIYKADEAARNGATE